MKRNGPPSPNEEPLTAVIPPTPSSQTFADPPARHDDAISAPPVAVTESTETVAPSTNPPRSTIVATSAATTTSAPSTVTRTTVPQVPTSTIATTTSTTAIPTTTATASTTTPTTVSSRPT